MIYLNARKTGHYALIMAKARGKPEAFTDEENEAMRVAMRVTYAQLLKQGTISNQTQFGKLIGVGQQSAGKILGKKRYGLSRPTALAYAVMSGFDSPETLLEDLGSKADPSAAPAGWLDRDYAVKHARRLGVDESVIDLVTARYAEWKYSTRKRWWWVERLVDLAREIEAEKETAKGPDSAPRMTGAIADTPTAQGVPTQNLETKPPPRRKRA